MGLFQRQQQQPQEPDLSGSVFDISADGSFSRKKRNLSMAFPKDFSEKESVFEQHHQNMGMKDSFNF